MFNILSLPSGTSGVFPKPFVWYVAVDLAVVPTSYSFITLTASSRLRVLTICEPDGRSTQVSLKNTPVSLKSTPVSLNSTQVSLNSSLVSLTVSIYDGGCSCLACLACFVHASHVCLACLACLAGSHIVHIPRLTTYPLNTLKSSSKKDDSNSPCLPPFYSNLDYIFLGSIRRQQESL